MIPNMNAYLRRKFYFTNAKLCKHVDETHVALLCCLLLPVVVTCKANATYMVTVDDWVSRAGIACTLL